MRPEVEEADRVDVWLHRIQLGLGIVLVAYTVYTVAGLDDWVEARWRSLSEWRRHHSIARRPAVPAVVEAGERIVNDELRTLRASDLRRKS